MFTGIRSLRGFVSLAAAIALVSLATAVALVSLGRDAAAQAPTFQLQVSPQDTSLNLDAANYSAQPLLMAYTWPDNQVANAILLKFDLSSLPAGATVQQAVVNMALVESDATADATYTMTARKQVGMVPVVAAATGYTADGVTPWTPSGCCYNGVPMAQSDLSAPYASLAVDKAPGFKTWTVTTMVQEWLANPASNFGLVMNADTNAARDRYRYFASTENADATLWPVLQITYSMPGDTTPPVISAVASSLITGATATISWTTDEAGDSQVEYGPTTAYESATSVTASLVSAHGLSLSGLSDARVYHYRVRSRDAAGNLAVSGDSTFKTLDKTKPAVSISSPAAGTTVSGFVTISAQATDNVGVASVQFRVDGVNLGARDTTAPYGVGWSTTTIANGAHTLTAIARDTANNATTSTAVTITVNNATADTTVPTVAITAPAAGTTVSGTAVAISATATDNVGVVGVQFMVDGANVAGEDTASPYGFSWNTTLWADGTHTLTAVARDAAGNATTSTAVTVTVSNSIADTTAPTVAITAPAAGTTVSGTAVAISATATDNVGVAGVQFKLDGVNLGAEDIATTYTQTWNTTTAANGTHTLTAVARDAAGNTTTAAAVTVTVDNGDTTPPTVSITAPASGSTASGSAVMVSATATDNVGVVGVQFKVDGANVAGEDTASPYSLSWNTTLWANGTHTLTAVARDAAGNATTSTAVTVTVSNSIADTTAPTVAITAPAAAATVSGNTVTVAATATDNVGVAGVQFKLDGVNLGGETTASPYTQTWNTTTAVNGMHTLTADARDAAGNATTSAAVTVTVSNSSGDTTAPTVAMSAPAAGATVSGTAVTVSATASDDVGVVGVQFKLDGADLGAEDTDQSSTSQLQRLSPQDTSLNIDATNYSAQPLLMAYTWPDNQIANTILLKFNLSALPAGAVVQQAVVNLALVESDPSVDATYTMTAYKLVGKNPVIAAATGYTADGATPWTPNACCFNGVPLAQADLSAPYASLAVDKTPGFKTWTITTMVQEWLASPASNVGLVLNADATVARDRYRYFASTKHADATLQPVLLITYSLPGATQTWNTTTVANGAHTLTAVARDAAGNTTTSTAVNVTVNNADITAPTVAITAPAAGATASGAAVTISATASDNVGVLGVQFKLDGVNLGAEDPASPYSLSWNSTTAANGTHTLTAVARDAAGNTTTGAAVAVTVNNGDTTPPTVSITAPASGSTASGSAVMVSATATDNVGVVGVQFKVDGANVAGEDTASPYSLSWNTTLWANGTHTLTAVARDAAGNTTTSTAVTVTVSNTTADTTPPTVAMSAPAAGATVSGTAVTVTATAADNVGVAGVQFKLDGANLGAEDPASPYSLSWNSTTTANGTHTLTAVARDAAGNTTTSTAVTVTVSNTTADTTPPTVAMSAPAAGATVSGTAVTVTATASDNVGVAGVQFKLDGANLGAEEPASPYSLSWNATTAANGTHTLTAVARDAAGNTTTAAARTVTVSNDTTPPVISSVAATAITSAGATISWTTNEISDSQVDYGVTTAYGTSSALDTTDVTSHSRTLGSLTASTTYHARVRSRDVAGNLAMSTDFTFATGSSAPPPSSGWPHEPSGFGGFASSSLDSFSGNGWDIVNSNGLASVVAGTSGSMTPTNVGQWKYPAGFAGGSAPATMFHALPSSFNEGFVGVMWKPSNPWQGHSTNVNKIFFLLGGACGNLIPIMYGPPGGPYQLRVAPEWGNWSWLTPNVNAVPIVLGAWHKIELYFSYSSHIVRWWMDGTLIGDYTNVTFPASGCFAEFQFSPTWGGVGDVKSQTDFFWFDDAYISRPGTGTITPPPPPPPSTGTILFQEGFEDANLAGRGWYDNPNVLLSTTEHIANSTRSLQYTFNQGATSPTAGSALRKTFTPTDSIYLGHWVKYSTNWVGSQQPYHPHQFHFLTTFDGAWSGLSFDYLTTYIEQNGGTPLIAIQDGVNVDQTRIGVNLTSTTENRGVAGCNGSSDGYPDNCYSNGSAFVNEKKWKAAAQYFTDTPGAFYKSDWHFIEAFVKMNSIVGGKGVNDGIVQYWFDGQLIIDHRDVLLRTGENAAMQFNQLVIAPYIGDGSPITQSLWIDSLTVATGRP